MQLRFFEDDGNFIKNAAIILRDFNDPYNQQGFHSYHFLLLLGGKKQSECWRYNYEEAKMYFSKYYPLEASGVIYL